MKIASNRWAARQMKILSGIRSECDSCAAIEGARMSEKDRDALKAVLYKAMEILSRY